MGAMAAGVVSGHAAPRRPKLTANLLAAAVAQKKSPRMSIAVAQRGALALFGPQETGIMDA